MSEALYRKYRPQQFTNISGQDQIVKALTGALAAKKTTQAYLFTGSRGTGKTSVARILARALGCSENDLVEIDAASHTQVEKIRELQDGIRTLPFDSPVKVYIIDEVHMLSNHAFNALLKTLEEPPAHVVFILATTDVQKVPETVLSRCEIHVFKKPSVETLLKTVSAIAKKEGYDLPLTSAQLIAFLGDGSFRDAIGLLQKVINASTDKKLTAEEVLSITGAPPAELIQTVITAIVEKKLPAALAAVQQAVQTEIDPKLLIKIILNEIRLIMLAIFAPEMKKVLATEVGEEKWHFIEQTAEKPGAKSLPAVLRELLTAYDDIGRAAVPELPLELALIRLLGVE